MADYNKQTVAQLRQLLKDRGIPSTGLTRKAQIVEKLEEADQNEESSRAEDIAGNAAPGSETPPAAEAPLDPVEQVKEAPEQTSAPESESAPGPGLAVAREPEEIPVDHNESAPAVPLATLDANREAVSHIDSDIPPPDRLTTIAGPAENTGMGAEADEPQPAGPFNAPPADPEDIVGPRVTEPADAEMDKTEADSPSSSYLPDTPGPAAEALRFANERQGNETVLEDTAESTAESSAAGENQSVEKPELLPIPERSTAETSRLNTEELEADIRKRKRRSDSPDLPSQDIRAKKARPSQEAVPEVHLKEDGDVIMMQASAETDPIADDEGTAGFTGLDTSQTEHAEASLEPDAPREKRQKTDRYRSLVEPSEDDAPQTALQDDRPIAPALHSATPALYIRDFMRPLRPEPLRAHLESLASLPKGAPDSSIIKALFLDAMKTHALVLFSSTIAASRVRASLHGAIWPPEGNRKELWVDFVPEDSVEDWIREEEEAMTAEKEGRATGRPIPAKRFEVVYPESSDGSVKAVFQEMGSSGSTNTPQAPRGNVDIRRPSHHTATAPTKDARQDIEQSFKTLDQLFLSTAAKPNLYYLPVSDEISEIRLKELDNETSREWAPGATRKGRGMKVEMKYKYTFDEDDQIVEVGEDRGPRGEDYRGRGGFRGRGRGGRSGLWRG